MQEDIKHIVYRLRIENEVNKILINSLKQLILNNSEMIDEEIKIFSLYSSPNHS